MNVLLVSANREKVPYPVLPIGIAYVASALEAAGHRVSVLDLCFERAPLKALARAVARRSPQLIGVGLRNMDNCDFYVPRSFLPEARAIVRECRRLSTAPIVVGGAAVSVMPEEIARYVGADFAVAGDGEEASVGLAAALEAGADPSAVPGVLSLRFGRTAGTPPAAARGLPPGLRPRIWRWTDLRPYLRTEGVYPVQSKRGCALRCVYCTYVQIEGSRYRFRTGSDVADEIAEIHAETGVSDFEFVDSTFNAPPHHAIEVARAVAARSLPVGFIGNGMNPVATTGPLLAEMRRAGFRALVSTAESASDAVLSSLRKGFNRAHLEEVARLTREAGLPTLWIFLVGGPGETPGTVRETLDFFGDCAGERDVAYVTSGVRIYPSTPLERIAVDEGFIRGRAELIEPRFYLSRSLDPKALRDLMRERAESDPRIVTSERAQSPLVPAGLRLLGALGVRKPFWRFAPRFNRAMRWTG